MKITGIICEYNPLHLGHKKQLDAIRSHHGVDSGIVCLMSGNFVQRGEPAILDKSLRAKAAILSGADLVLELPVTASLSSAEGFAQAGVSILSGFCDYLCFGAECRDEDALLSIAQALLSADFPEVLRQQLSTGLSFPAARQKALEQLGYDGNILTQPNNILATEYCKAILQQKSSMKPMPIVREGNYHDLVPDTQNPSATALRAQMEKGAPWKGFVPTEAVSCFENAALHTLKAGEQAVLYRLRSMTEGEFAALPYGSEGLWRKLMHAVSKEATLEEIFTATKSKRYTRTRLNRMVLCAFLGITQKDLETPAPYARVLALNSKGREILKLARKTGHFPNIGEIQESPYQILENRCGNLYGLFSTSIPEPADAESRQRIYCE